MKAASCICRARPFFLMSAPHGVGCKYEKRQNVLQKVSAKDIPFCIAQALRTGCKHCSAASVLLRCTVSQFALFCSRRAKLVHTRSPMKNVIFSGPTMKKFGAMHQKNTFMLPPHIKLESVVSVQNDTHLIDGATLRMVLCISSAGNHPSEWGMNVPFLPGWETNLAGSRAVALRHKVRTTVLTPGKL